MGYQIRYPNFAPTAVKINRLVIKLPNGPFKSIPRTLATAFIIVGPTVKAAAPANKPVKSPSSIGLPCSLDS